MLLGQEASTDPGGVKWPAHVADLLYPGLQRANPAADEGPEQVVRGELLLRDVLFQHLVDGVDFEVQLPQIEVLVVLLGGRRQAECRQIDEVYWPGAHHVEEGSLPLAAGL